MLLVPFQMPQVPSADHRLERTVRREVEDLRSRMWGEGRGLRGGDWGVCTCGPG